MIESRLGPLDKNLLAFTFLSTLSDGVHPSMVPCYLSRTHSDSWGLIFHRLIRPEHAKLINMGERSLTYHFPIWIYITQAHTLTCPPLTHMKSLTPQGEEEIMGSSLERKWGRRPDLKKEETEAEIHGKLFEEESFQCQFPQVCGLVLACGPSCTVPLGKNTQENIYTTDYSAVTAKNGIFAPLLR